MFNRSKKPNTEPTLRNPEGQYEDAVVQYEDGWSTIEVSTPGDSIDLMESVHKYLRNPAFDPSGSLMLSGLDGQGNDIRLFIITGEFGVIEQTSPDGTVSVEAMLLDPSDADLQGTITIGEPYDLPDGDRFERVTAVAADYKYGGVKPDREATGTSPFRQADSYLRDKFPGIDNGDLTPRD